jgi:hypothetical protein
MPVGDALTMIERTEAYEHGRTQGRLAAARHALDRILKESEGRHRVSGHLVSAIAKLGLHDSDPDRMTPPLTREEITWIGAVFGDGWLAEGTEARQNWVATGRPRNNEQYRQYFQGEMRNGR